MCLRARAPDYHNIIISLQQATPERIANKTIDAIDHHLTAMPRQHQEQPPDPHPHMRNLYPRRWVGPVESGFFVALGELRAIFGTNIGLLAVQYGIDVEDELREILPPVDEDLAE